MHIIISVFPARIVYNKNAEVLFDEPISRTDQLSRSCQPTCTEARLSSAMGIVLIGTSDYSKIRICDFGQFLEAHHAKMCGGTKEKKTESPHEIL